jgi:SHS2 domain-containing protein
MDAEESAGSREISHTADWELHVWASDLCGLLEQAALGMYRLQGAKLKTEPRLTRRVELTFSDPESLLVDFLSELLYFTESERIGFDQFELRITDQKLQARITGAPLSSLSKEIKAVTYHNLTVRKIQSGLEANVVFDV